MKSDGIVAKDAILLPGYVCNAADVSFDRTWGCKVRGVERIQRERNGDIDKRVPSK